MGIFHEFPYTNLHDINIDWLLETMKKLESVYESVPADLTEIVNQWFIDHPEAITTIADGEVTKIKLGEDVLSTYVLIPDEFDGTDTQKLQACFNALTNGGHIVINRALNIEDDIIHYLDSNQDKPIYIHGLGKNAKINMNGHSFVGDWQPNKPTGNLYFESLWFTGTGTCFDCNSLIRMYFHDCYFTGFGYIFKCSAGTNSGRLQTIYCTNCTFRRNGIIMDNQGQCNDIHFLSNNFEYNTSVFVAGENCRCSKLDISHNLMEGHRGTCIVIRLGIGCNVSYNYFESNSGYIDCNDGQNRSTVIKGNYASGSVGGYFVLLPRTAPLYSLHYNNSITENDMAYRNLEIIAIDGTPQSRLSWRVEDNLANDIPQNIRFFLDRGAGFDSYGEPITDFNAIYCGGFYTTDGSAMNAPAEGRGNIQVYQGAGDNIVQEFTPTYNNNSGMYYRRTGTATHSGGIITVNWTEWKKFGPYYEEEELYVPANENGSCSVAKNAEYLVSISKSAVIGLYTLHTDNTGTGTLTAIAATPGIGAVTISNQIFTIKGASTTQIIRFIRL